MHETAASFERTWAQSDEARKTLKAVWAFRERLRKDLFEWGKEGERPAITVRELNELMSQHPMLNKIKPEIKACRQEEHSLLASAA